MCTRLTDRGRPTSSLEGSRVLGGIQTLAKTESFSRSREDFSHGMYWGLVVVLGEIAERVEQGRRMEEVMEAATTEPDP